MRLSKKEEDYIFKAAAGCLPTKSQRLPMRKALNNVISNMGRSWEACVDELSQGNRTVALAWAALTFRVISTSQIFGPDHTSIIGDTYRVCLELGLTGQAFVEVWVGAGEDVVTFLDHIAARLDQKRAVDTAWEKATGAVS